MNVTFQGFRNTGVQNITLKRFPNEEIKISLLNLELTNDITGKDLNSFEKILKKYPNEINHNFLNLGIWEYKDKFNEGSTYSGLVINDKDCIISYKNLSLLEKVANLIKKILNTSEAKFVVNKDYIENEAANHFFFSNSLKSDEKNLYTMHSPENVKQVSKDILKKMTKMVDEFLS